MGINSVNSQMRGLGELSAPEMLMEKILAVTQYVKSSNETLQESLIKQYGHLDIVAFRATLFKIYGMPENVAYVPNWAKALIAPVAPAAPVAPVAPAAPASSAVLPAVAPLPAFQIKEDAPQGRTTPAPLTAAQLADIKKKEDQKKMLMYGGIGVGVLVLLGGIWYLTKD